MFLQKPGGGGGGKGGAAGAMKRGDNEEEDNSMNVSKWPMWKTAIVFGSVGTGLVCCFGRLFWLFCMLHSRFRAVREYHVRAKDSDADTITFREYLKYRFAYWFVWTRGSNAIFIIVLITTVLILGAILYRVCVGQNILTSAWLSFVWLVAPDAGAGEMTLVGAAIGAFMSILGLIFFALLLTLMQDSFTFYLEEIKSGSSPVMETGHMLLIGITDNTMPIIHELCKAYEVSGGATIVILSGTLSKVDMECKIIDMGLDMLGSRIVVREGKGCCQADLKMVSADSAQSIIIMADRDQPKEIRDAFVMRALITLRGQGWPVQGRILAACSLIRNKFLLEHTSGPNTDVVMLDSFIGKLMVQCSKHQGLGTIVKAFFGFDGSEFYITPAPDHLLGKTIANAALHYPSAVVCGVMRTGEKESCKLCTGNDYKLQAGEELVLLATDSSCITAGTKPCQPPELEHLSRTLRSPRPSLKQSQSKTEKILMLGINEKTGYIILELDNIVPKGTEIVLVSPKPAEERNEVDDIAQNLTFKKQLENVTLKQVEGRLGSRYMLEELPDNAVTEASRIFILGDDDAESPKDADTCTIGVMLQLRDILVDARAEEAPGRSAAPKVPIVPEIQDPDSELHCVMIRAPDFIDTSGLPAQVLAMIAYNPRVAVVLEEILTESSGVHFAISRLQDYIQPGTEPPSTISFVQVQYLAGLSGDVVVGWSRLGAESEEPENQFQIAMQEQASCSASVTDWEINPKDKLTEREWHGSRDRLVVLCAAV